MPIHGGNKNAGIIVLTINRHKVIFKIERGKEIFPTSFDFHIISLQRLYIL